MTDNVVRHIAPFINDRFLITYTWWERRVNPVTGVVEYHKGIDLATAGSKPVYSILDGIVHSLGYDSGRGNWIIIKDNNPASPTYGYATQYMHLANAPDVSVGDNVVKGQKVGDEGTTGSSSGIHLHLVMQNLNRFNNQWYFSDNESDYINPCDYMGIDNIKNSWWIYDGTPVPPTPTITRKKKFPWVIYQNKLRKKFRNI